MGLASERLLAQNGGVSETRLRLVESSECALIFSFLTIAARMADTNEPIQKALVDPELTKYWLGWGEADDLGVVATRLADGLPVSCAWVRRLGVPSQNTNHDFLELAFGTVEAERGRGVGTQTLLRLLELCAERAPGVTLSVRASNPALRLYRRLGFEVVSELTNRVGTASRVMALRFAHSGP
jgi:GNAT superfamily N-acetyltransferase